MASKQDKAINLMVFTNLSQREIAKKLDVREETVSRWKKQESFQSKKEELQREFLKDLVAPAMRGLKDLIDADSEFVKLEAIKTILDRAGYDSVDNELKNLEKEKQETQIKKTKTEIEIMKGISEEIEDLDDIDGMIYGKD
ncbi:phBC6A51 family helix-turn-helix protein [Anaerococcus vaginimassiliensis]|uniref:phBC6A51 family helix-turn-helix protein n=1 Tax=Anaerococcus vaginimassiliensis TaxID=2042308 RepID=UPI0010321E6E|nr:phBC6A51 family helix-turn-helix protein [Anaerococcus vaginimassiliensis]